MIFAIKITLKILKGIIKAVVFPIKLVVKLFQRSDVSAGDVANSVPNTSTREIREKSSTAIASESDSEQSETSDSLADSESTTFPSSSGSVTSNYYERFYMGLFAIAGLNALFILSRLIQYELRGAWWKAGLVVTVLVPSVLGYWVQNSSTQGGGLNIAFAYGIFLLISSTFNQFMGELTGVYFILSRPRFWMLEKFASNFVIVFFSLANYAAIFFVVYCGYKIRTQGSVNKTEASAMTYDAETPAGDSQPSNPNSSGSENDVSSESETPETTVSSESAPSGDAPVDHDVVEDDSAGESTTATSADDEPSQEKPKSDTEPTADEEPSTPGVAAPDEILAQIDDQVTANDVQRLGTALTEYPATDEVLAALDEWADSDDPEIRIAVCEACAEIEDSKSEDILQLLKIDRNDRVMRAATDAM
ncbi:hypothetical protein [Halonotius aquaticus]|uniref:hypothetical protein n=1 Tax=Halonotius aquaticus TaxID=2216978 RepID=UPI0014028F8D|nr:hypothetical protein [Halonotius aquaticus]